MNPVLVGIPWDKSSSFTEGPAKAPQVIHEWLKSDISSPYSLSGNDLTAVIESFEDLSLSNQAEFVRQQIKSSISSKLENDNPVICLGGDHSVTLPILNAFFDKYGPMNVLHIDAHPDMYESLGGDRYSHACPFRRAIEAGYIRNIVQVGLRSVSPCNREFGRDNGVIMLGADDIDHIPYDDLNTPLYISIDLDGLDPAFAPGVSHPEPGGLSTRDVLRILSQLRAKPVGADIVELNPRLDHNNITAHLACRLTKEIAALMQN